MWEAINGKIDQTKCFSLMAQKIGKNELELYSGDKCDLGQAQLLIDTLDTKF